MLKLVNEDVIFHDDHEDVKVKFYIDHYQADNSLYVGVLDTRENEPYADLTVCLNDSTLGKDEAYVDTNNCPSAIKLIDEYKMGKPTGKVGKSGFCEYPVYKFDLTKIKELNEYDLTDEQKEHIEEALAAVVPAVEVTKEESDAEEPAEEKPIEEAPVSEDTIQRALCDSTNYLVNEIWNLISSINGTITVFEEQFDKPEKENVIDILNNIVTDLTVDVGMVNKVIEYIDAEKVALIDKGEEKAEKIANE